MKLYQHWFIIEGTEQCVDFPNYKDKYLTTCQATKDFGNCVDGKPGKVSEVRLREDANTDGVSPLDACCVCGGGKGWYFLFLFLNLTIYW